MALCHETVSINACACYGIFYFKKLKRCFTTVLVFFGFDFYESIFLPPFSVLLLCLGLHSLLFSGVQLDVLRFLLKHFMTL